MVTLSEIAKESGFSIPVVSRVLSLNPHKDARVAESTRVHIQAIATRLKYRPNRNAEFLKRGKNPIIGCFLPNRADSLLADLMKGLAEEAEKSNFPLAFYFDMTQKSYLEFIQHSKTTKNCGIITYPYFKMDPEIERVVYEYQSCGGKIVLIEANSDCWRWNNCTSVSIDNYFGGKLAAEYLLKRDVKFCLTMNYENIMERTRGFIDTLANKGHGVRVTEDIETIIRELKRNKNVPVGIFLPRDQDALTLLCELQQNKMKVGNDILLVGYDNQYFAEYTKPGLTSVSQPFYKIGKLAMHKLIAKIYDKNAPSVLVKPELIIRGSA